jgi:hypothetical protein
MDAGDWIVLATLVVTTLLSFLVVRTACKLLPMPAPPPQPMSDT